MLIVISFKRTPDLIRNVAFFVALAITVVGQSHFPQHCHAQSQQTPATEAPITEAKTVKEKTKRYHELIDGMRDKIQEVTKAKMRFYFDGADESYTWKSKWESEVAELIPLRTEFESIAIDLYLNAADDREAPDSLLATMLSMRDKLMSSDRTGEAIAVLERLVKAQPELDQLKLDLATSLIKANQFARGNKLIDAIPPGVLSDLVGNDNDLLKERTNLETMHKQEQKILAAESDSNLPRVELQTTQGPIIIELFENEAPDTVGNFISLVESGFYNDVIFHRVIAGLRAQTGLVVQAPNQQYYPRPVGYTIHDELNKKSRGHYQGYLSMAKTPQPNSSSSEFFILYEPAAFLNGHHTVFGRVIKGMDNAGSFQPTFTVKEEEGKHEEVLIESVKPDRILSAKVIRKRDHPYKPNKVGAP